MKFRPLKTTRKTNKNHKWMQGFSLAKPLDDLALSQAAANRIRRDSFAKKRIIEVINE